MTNEEILKEVKKIEELSRKSEISEAAKAVRIMSTCNNVTVLQMFLQGLSQRLDSESSLMLRIWSLSYDIGNEEDIPHAEL